MKRAGRRMKRSFTYQYLSNYVQYPFLLERALKSITSDEKIRNFFILQDGLEIFNKTIFYFENYLNSVESSVYTCLKRISAEG